MVVAAGLNHAVLVGIGHPSVGELGDQAAGDRWRAQCVAGGDGRMACTSSSAGTDLSKSPLVRAGSARNR